MYGNQGALIGFRVKINKLESLLYKLVNNLELDESDKDLMETFKLKGGSESA